MAQLIQLPGLKQRFVAGMRWRHEDQRPTPTSLAKASRDYGKWGLGWRTSLGGFQSAYMPPLAGMKRPRDLLSLAAIIADVKSEPWQGRFDLGDGRFWLIAVRDNQEILPNGDVVGDEASIVELQDEMASLGHWEEEIEGTIEDLAELIRREGIKRHRAARIVDLQHKTWMAPAVGIAALGVVSALGLHEWQAHQRALARQREEALARQQAVERAMAEKAAAAAANIVPWQAMPLPSVVLNACATSWDRQPLDFQGWDLVSWHCQAQGPHAVISTRWANVGGSPLTAPGVISMDGKASHGNATGAALTEQGPATAEPQQMGVREVLALQSDYGLRVALRPVPAPSPAPGAKKVAAPAWNAISVQVKSVAPLWSMGLQPVLDHIEGLRMSEILWSPGGWIANGTLYTR